MRKIFTKILCLTATVVSAVGILSVSACSDVYKSQPLKYTPSDNAAVSNGGFAVQKDDYVYFINGKETNTAENTYGTPVKGAIMRISKENLKERNYAETETVVPQIAYSGNSNAGLFIYGDYIYYSTPSTELNSDGEVQNSMIAFKSTKLDGTESMRGFYAQYSNNAIEYRYVEVDNTVYLVYVATSEDLYGTSYTNIHSVNTKTNEDTLLAYNVDTVIFDKNDVTNPQIYYTMNVKDFEHDVTYSNYNQIWTVRADATTPNDYSAYFENIDDYDAEEDPLYVNCGQLVFDGIGIWDGKLENVTPFNSQKEKDDLGNIDVARSAYTYKLSSYENGVLFYTRTNAQDSTELLFTAKQSTILDGNGKVSENWYPVKNNPDDGDCLSRSGGSANNYTYLFDENKDVQQVIISGSYGLEKAQVVGGKIVTEMIDSSKHFYMTTTGQPTVLFLDGDYIYYSLSGGNGYTVHRMRYDGDYNSYNGLPEEDKVTEYTSVRLLDIDSSSDWYKPEIIENQLLFPSETRNMTDYNYVMVCDLRDRATGTLMDNAGVDRLNKKYESITESISDIDSSVYQNLQNALWYAHFTSDKEYIRELSQAYVDIMKYDIEHFWSNESLKKYDEFIDAKAGGEWDEFAATVKVNKEDVAANKRDYYYSILGQMNEDDAEAYGDLLKTNYLQSYPEKEQTWFESLSTGAKAGFIIGVVAGGLIVIAAAVIITLVILKKRKQKMPVYRKERRRVDTTDDKDIDVYSDEERSPENE